MSADWRELALCRSFDDLPWTVDPENRPGTASTQMAVVCGACTVLSECEEAVEQLEVTTGFWAGQDRDSNTQPRGDEAA